MDNSKKWKSMLGDAIKQHPLEFQEFNKTKNLQDQIQEMIYSPLGIYATSAMFEEIAAFGMSTWKKNLPTMEKDQEITSGEQLWLAFYMWELHQKKWLPNELKWVKI